MIRDEFALSATQVGLLSSIPPALFAIAALAGSLLTVRFGVRGALMWGLALVAAGSALRGVSRSYALLLATHPGHVGGRRHHAADHAHCGAAAAAAPHRAGHGLGPPGKWLPDWHVALVWRLGALFCCINAIYFSANAFIPIYLTSEGRPDLISSALTALNVGQLPASLLLLLVAGKMERKAWPYVVSGLVSLVSIGGLVMTVGPATIVWAALLGFSDATALNLALTLPPLLCRTEDVAHMSAGMFTISYGGAVAVAIVSGAAWDVSGIPALAFAPLSGCAIGLAAVTLSLRANKALV